MNQYKAKPNLILIKQKIHKFLKFKVEMFPNLKIRKTLMIIIQLKRLKLILLLK